MSNNIEVNYHTTGKSTVTNKLGMRQMQERVYAKRNSKYLLVHHLKQNYPLLIHDEIHQ